MIFSLIAEALSIGVLIALIVCGVIMLAFAILGIVIKAREVGGTSKRVKKANTSAKATAPKVEEKYYDFTHLTEEEKDLIRKHRDRK